jgi:CheY-like chemotaxis protein
LSGAGGYDGAREIARGLSQLLTQALEDGAPVGSLEAARDLAQLLSLRGLDRLLGALSPHAGGAWPAALKPAMDQLRRTAEECGREENVDALRRVDDELALMAQAIERVPLTGAEASARPNAAERAARTAAESAPVTLGEALDGLPVQRENDALLKQVRLHPPVAGALRAALDWLLGEGTPRLRLWLASDGSALEVTCEGIVFSGVLPASQVLTNVGAHLGSAADRPGAWTVRVPILAERETFLMIEQDELALAVPWHAVARVRLMPADTIDAMARRQGLPVLAPLAVAPRRAAEQPVIVVALGLKRACLVADRLIWRMSAQPAEAIGPPPAPGIAHAVRSDDGELYWVLDPAWLLRDVAAPVLADSGRHRAPPAEPVAPILPPAPEPRVAPPAPIPFPSAFVRARIEPSTSDLTRALGPQDIEPLEAEATPGADAPPAEPAASEPAAPAATGEATAMGSEPAASTASSEMTVAANEAPAHAAASELAPAPSHAPAASRETLAPAPRLALVAEDSITARIFLVRLLEQRGFAVQAVGTAAELRALLPHGPWALVCVDLELPDACGPGFLNEVIAGAGATHSPLVSLVRDAADDSMARAAGVAATLRKPYERDALDRVLARLVPDLLGRPRDAQGGAADPFDWGRR